MKNKKIIWTTVLGTVICILFAILFFGMKFTDITQPPVYFLILGLAGSLSLALLREQKLRDVIYSNLFIYFLFAIVLAQLKAITALILLIYYTSMVLAIYIYVKNFDQKLAQISFARTLVLAATMGVFYIAANFIHSLLFIDHFSIKFLLRNFPLGFLLGLGYGLAGEISEKYLVDFEKIFSR